MNLEYPPGATPIDPDEAEALVPDIATQRELNEFEAQNIAKAQKWARTSSIVRSRLLSDDALRRLHRQMFDRVWRWAGQYRQTQKSIGVEAHNIGMEVRNLCEDAKTWLECRTYPPDEILARFHHRLVWVHPFPNGNGRHARLATDLLCSQNGWRLFTWGSTNLTVEGNVRDRYISALRAADRHDFQPLLRFARE